MEQWFAQKIFFLVPFWISLGIHEWAHAAMAMRLGDDTAYRLGRMTINPIAHLDPIGTVLLPILGVPFGWAKPVPIQPSRFRSDVSLRTGVMLTAAAGPASNLALALLVYLSKFVLGSVDPLIEKLLTSTVQLNVALAVFNMLPIPPLDGSRVVEGLASYSRKPTWPTYAAMFGVGLVVACLLFLMLR